MDINCIQGININIQAQNSYLRCMKSLLPQQLLLRDQI